MRPSSSASRMAWKAWLLFAALPLPLILAGCASCAQGPPVSARGITSADADSGIRGFALDVIVTDGPGGPPLPGAGVVAYYGGADRTAWDGPRIELDEDRIAVEPMNDTPTTDSKEVLRMLTGAEGRATARVPGNRIIGIVAAKDGYTEEWIPAIAAGDTGSSGSITVPLYRANMSIPMDAVWGPGGASTGEVTSSQFAWDPHEVPFGDTADARRGYAARIVELSVTLSWENSAMGGGDLGIGAGPPDDTPRYFEDAGQNIGPGAQTVRTTLGLQQLQEHGILGAPAIHLGAATDSGFVAPFGLPYTMLIEARFDTARAAFGACSSQGQQDDSDGLGASVPAWGPIGAVVALVGTALARRQKRT